MKLNGIVSSIIAAGLLFGSAGMAAAATSQDGNPFALYQDWSEPANDGAVFATAPADSGQQVADASAAKASGGAYGQSASVESNPFALYQDWSEPENIPAALSNGDNSLSEVYADPFN